MTLLKGRKSSVLALAPPGGTLGAGELPSVSRTAKTVAQTLVEPGCDRAPPLPLHREQQFPRAPVRLGRCYIAYQDLTSSLHDG